MLSIFLDCFKNRFGKIVELAVVDELLGGLFDVVDVGAAAAVE